MGRECGKEGSWGWRELGGMKEGKTVTRLYCMRKESIFNEKNKRY